MSAFTLAIVFVTGFVVGVFACLVFWLWAVFRDQEDVA